MSGNPSPCEGSCEYRGARREGGGWRTLTLMATIVCVLTGWALTQAEAQLCAGDTVGVDVSLADNAAGTLFGESPGQTFLAVDTLLSFLRVWRWATEDSNSIGMRLYITDTSPDGTPDLRYILVNGPTIVHQYGDGIHPIEFVWRWEPPLALPHRGLFSFFVMQDPCFGFWDLMSTDNPSLYPSGDMWFTGRSNCVLGSGLQRDLRHYPEYDIVFQAAFCRLDTTPTRRKTWGSLKLLYR